MLTQTHSNVAIEEHVGDHEEASGGRGGLELAARVDAERLGLLARRQVAYHVLVDLTEVGVQVGAYMIGVLLVGAQLAEYGHCKVGEELFLLIFFFIIFFFYICCLVAAVAVDGVNNFAMVVGVVVVVVGSCLLFPVGVAYPQPGEEGQQLAALVRVQRGQLGRARRIDAELDESLAERRSVPPRHLIHYKQQKHTKSFAHIRISVSVIVVVVDFNCEPHYWPLEYMNKCESAKSKFVFVLFCFLFVYLLLSWRLLL